MARSLGVERTFLGEGMAIEVVLTFGVQRLRGSKGWGRGSVEGAGLRENGRRGGVNIGDGELRSRGEGVRRQRG
jgi:hypothetical protein